MADDVTREVDRLLKDRAKYEDWLSRLEREKTEATARAYDRVQADYRQRLEEVLARLRAHSEAIQGRLRQTQRTAEELERERAERADRLDEARLRRTVGEYTEEREWTELETRLVRSLDEADAELSKTRADIDRLNEIIAAMGTAEVASPKAEAAVSAEPTVPHEPVVPEAVPEPAVEEAVSEEEVAAAAPVAEPRLEPEPEPEPFQAAEPPRPEPLLAEEPADEGFLSLEELIFEDEDLAEADVSPFEAEPPPTPAEEPAVKDVAGTGASGVGDELAFLESLSLGGKEEDESFSFLEQHGSGSAKTIVCPHCSAANDPAEWYCTECGEELPAE